MSFELYSQESWMRLLGASRLQVRARQKKVQSSMKRSTLSIQFSLRQIFHRRKFETAIVVPGFSEIGKGYTPGDALWGVRPR